ncbi:hypothetical protein FACS1894195_1470 [Bacteroidia bacterium]|nr:hypothetical protein FACS1894195_1470 [Bacteroidia bacterium]
MSLVIVKPIQKENEWHGVKDPSLNFDQPKIYEVLYNSKTAKYENGLTKEEVKKFERELGIDLSDKFNENEPHPFYSSRLGRIELPMRSSIWNTDQPLENLKLYFMRASKFVANSFKEWKEGKYPQATHYIEDEGGEVSERATKIEQRNKAWALANEMNLDEKIALVRILSKDDVKENSNNYINVRLDEIIERNVNAFLKFAAMDKKQLFVRGSVLNAISRNILTKEGSAIFYMGERIGNDIDEAVEWFLNPENRKMKTSILEKLNAK